MEKPNGRSKGLGRLLRLVFSRMTVITLLLFLQIFILYASFRWLDQELAFKFFVILSFCEAVYILNQPINTSYKIAWMIPILAVPVFGGLFYLFFRLQKSPRKLSRRIAEIREESKIYMEQNQKVRDAVSEDSRRELGMVHYLNKTAGYSTYTNTSVLYFPTGEAFFPKLKEELRKAKKFIFMEYFIIASGEIWDGPDGILPILIEKAKEGVEVRVMYDGTCCISKLSFKYQNLLESYGIQCSVFSPIRPAIATYQNNRDHRKIVVIDGNTGFTGGINLADEYANLTHPFGHWKDVAIMLKGHAVEGLTMMFLQMWNIRQEGIHDYQPYKFKHVTDCFDDVTARDGYVTPFGDSPFDEEDVGETMYINILNSAEKYVHIMTPYLILDDVMIHALIFAAKRGVEVKILMPHIPDKWYAFCLARSHYKQLLEGGVQIYEYTPGFVHAKIFVSDDIRAIVGTINLDFRSLYLHFEDGCYLYQKKMIRDIEKDFQETLKVSQEIDMNMVRSMPLSQIVVGSCLKIIAPLM